jgi:tripartite ATP-independent transporter DctP family solute receptor
VVAPNDRSNIGREENMKLLRLLVAPLFAGLLFAAGSANAAKVTMNIGYSVNEGHPYGTFMHLFAERFETLSGGTVRVKVHCCHKMGSEQEQFKKLQLGTLDGTMIAQNNAGPFFPKIDLLVLPYMIQNYEHAVKIADGPVGKEIWGDMPKEVGVHLYSIPLFSFRHIYNTKMPINNLADFAKMKYRVPKNKVMVATYKAFGSDPVPIAWSEALTATQTGTVDGGDLPLDVQYSQKFHDVAKHVAMTGHFVLAPPFFVSDKFMSKLDDSQKEAMDMAARIATAASRFHTNYGMSIVQKKMEAAGVTFTQPDIGPWVEKAKLVHADFAKERGPEYAAIMDKIYAAAK